MSQPVLEMTLAPKATAPLLLIDLSSLLYPIWHLSADAMLTNPNVVSEQTVTRVRALSSGFQAVAVCCDGGRSFRYDIDPTYKANRGERDAALIHQMRLAKETLEKDGLAVWTVAGYEADDLIATATREAITREIPVVIASADKDLLALVDDTANVRVKSLKTGDLIDEAGVVDKFGVLPGQMGDYLALVGDSADNIKGAPGIGPKGAQALLLAHGTLEAIFERVPLSASEKPSVKKTLTEHRDAILTGRKLIALATNVPIAFETALTRPEPPPIPVEDEMPEPDALELLEELPLPTKAPEPTTALAPRPQVMPAEWSDELEPRNMKAAIELANLMFQAKLFGAYGSAQAVLSTIMAGRELGMPAMASLRNFHIIDNKPTLSAASIVAILLKSGKVKYFRCIERSATAAAFETQRGDDPALTLRFTIEEARQAWAKDDKAWAASGWGKNPADLLVARASSKLARLVAPDVVAGLYDPDELS